MTWMPGCGAIRRSCFWTPYAKALDGQVHWGPAVYGYLQGGDDRVRNDADSAPFVPRSVVTNPWFEWGDDHLLRTPWHETVLYECHVKGFTMCHPDIPPNLRGTYAGLAHPAAIDRLRRLGVTAVELMRVHHFGHDHWLVERGLHNYSLGVFLNGDTLPDPDRRGRRLSDDTFLLLSNAHYDEISFLLPGEKMGQQWLTDLDTAASSTRPETRLAGTTVAVAAYSLQILRRV